MEDPKLTQKIKDKLKKYNAGDFGNLIPLDAKITGIIFVPNNDAFRESLKVLKLTVDQFSYSPYFREIVLQHVEDPDQKFRFIENTKGKESLIDVTPTSDGIPAREIEDTGIFLIDGLLLKSHQYEDLQRLSTMLRFCPAKVGGETSKVKVGKDNGMGDGKRTAKKVEEKKCPECPKCPEPRVVVVEKPVEREREPQKQLSPKKPSPKKLSPQEPPQPCENNDKYGYGVFQTFEKKYKADRIFERAANKILDLYRSKFLTQKGLRQLSLIVELYSEQYTKFVNMIKTQRMFYEKASSGKPPVKIVSSQDWAEAIIEFNDLVSKFQSTLDENIKLYASLENIQKECVATPVENCSYPCSIKAGYFGRKSCEY